MDEFERMIRELGLPMPGVTYHDWQPMWFRALIDNTRGNAFDRHLWRPGGRRRLKQAESLRSMWIACGRRELTDLEIEHAMRFTAIGYGPDDHDYHFSAATLRWDRWVRELVTWMSDFYEAHWNGERLQVCSDQCLIHRYGRRDIPFAEFDRQFRAALDRGPQDGSTTA